MRCPLLLSRYQRGPMLSEAEIRMNRVAGGAGVPGVK